MEEVRSSTAWVSTHSSHVTVYFSGSFAFSLCCYLLHYSNALSVCIELIFGLKLVRVRYKNPPCSLRFVPERGPRNNFNALFLFIYFIFFRVTFNGCLKWPVFDK